MKTQEQREKDRIRKADWRWRKNRSARNEVEFEVKTLHRNAVKQCYTHKRYMESLESIRGSFSYEELLARDRQWIEGFIAAYRTMMQQNLRYAYFYDGKWHPVGKYTGKQHRDLGAYVWAHNPQCVFSYANEDAFLKQAAPLKAAGVSK